MMEPILKEFTSGLEQISFSIPRQTAISNITGLPLTDDQALDLDYWAEQIRRPVKFSSGLSGLLLEQDSVFIEL